MTKEQILNYFGDTTVYHYDGSLKELQELMESSGNSYNYIIVSNIIYFAAINPVVDSKAQILAGE